uniref:Uncharacterized protein n=1 Tax=Helianthus annuus TaxID=4232 RepID=A0A251U513_HELAN
MIVCSATTSASGVICVISTCIHVVIIMLFTRPYINDYGSDYKWSVIVILITQFTGVILGSVAPISRCFASLSFKVSIKWIWNHLKVSYLMPRIICRLKLLPKYNRIKILDSMFFNFKMIWCLLREH